MKEDSMNGNFEPEKMTRVDCLQFEEVLPELDRPGTPGAALREAALAHAEMCSRCGALVTEAESLDFALGQIAQATAELQRIPESKPPCCANSNAESPWHRRAGCNGNWRRWAQQPQCFWSSAFRSIGRKPQRRIKHHRSPRP